MTLPLMLGANVLSMLGGQGQQGGGFWQSPGGAAAVGGIGSLLSGILGGVGQKQQDERQFQNWQRMMQERQRGLGQLRPEGEFQQWGLDPVLAQAISGSLAQRTGMELDLSARVPGSPTQRGLTTGTVRGAGRAAAMKYGMV